MELLLILFIMESLVKFDESLPFAIVCHDAGGANQLIAIAQSLKWKPTFIIMDGPAKTLWQKSFPHKANICRDFSSINQVKTLITSTSWASTLEHDARLEAKKNNIRSITILDHWVNYFERFHMGPDLVLPDELWVVDGYAEVLARRLFSTLEIKRIPDYYSNNQVAKIRPINENTPNHLLYLTEPIRSNWGFNIPGEIQALEFFLSKMAQLKLPKNTIIKLKLHPSEKQGKYIDFLEKNSNSHIEISSGDLSDVMSDCRWVAGCQTYAMTLALLTGRKVFSSMPPWAPTCALPHGEILHLRDL